MGGGGWVKSEKNISTVISKISTYDYPLIYIYIYIYYARREGGGGIFQPVSGQLLPSIICAPKHCLRWSYGITDRLRPYFSDFCRFQNFSNFLTPVTPSDFFQNSRFASFSGAKSGVSQKSSLFGVKTWCMGVFQILGTKMLRKCSETAGGC